MAGLDLTAYNYALQTQYPDSIESEVFEDNPFLAMVRKEKDFYGNAWAIELKYADSAGRSAVFSTAQNNVGAHKGARFTSSRVRDYAVSVVDRETLKASQSSEGAAAQALDMEMESLVNKARNSLGRAVWGSGSGSMGIVGSLNSTTITLATIDDVVHFEQGDVIALSATDGTGSVRTGTAPITGVNRNTGVLTVNTTLITGAAANDFISFAGDYAALMQGVQAWIPLADPTSTAFNGVDRTQDIVRLSGVRFDGTSMPKDEALVLASARLRREGGRPGHCFMNPMDTGDLQNILGSRVLYEEVEAAGIGFQAILVKVPGGVIKVFEDRNCPRGKGLLTDISSWELKTLGDLCEWVDEDGNKFLRRSTTDDFELRVATYGNLGNHRPGHSAWVSFS